LGRRYILGFTLLEIMFAIVIVAALAAIAIPSYKNYIEKLKVNEAIAEISEISLAIERFHSVNLTYPASLAQLGVAFPLDPWGHPYKYLAIAVTPPPNTGHVRRDRSLTPINTDYDLYSMGKDGLTATQLNSSKARDDIVRASNGEFIGLASDY
jgi:general secretion pathway protein G